jgi:single-strand DNA-binding protein
MKSVTIAGNIGKDAVTRTTGGGDKVTSWSVAVEDRQGQDKRTIWFDCSLWGKRGESLAQYLTKGGKVAVSGELSTREHEGKTYLTVRAEQVTLLGGGDQRQDDAQRGQAGGAPAGGRNAMDDEIPFAPEWR